MGIPLRGILHRAVGSCDWVAAAVPRRTLGAEGLMSDTGAPGTMYIPLAPESAMAV